MKSISHITRSFSYHAFILTSLRAKFNTTIERAYFSERQQTPSASKSSAIPTTRQGTNRVEELERSNSIKNSELVFSNIYPSSLCAPPCSVKQSRARLTKRRTTSLVRFICANFDRAHKKEGRPDSSTPLLWFKIRDSAFSPAITAPRKRSVYRFLSC